MLHFQVFFCIHAAVRQSALNTCRCKVLCRLWVLARNLLSCKQDTVLSQCVIQSSTFIKQDQHISQFTLEIDLFLIRLVLIIGLQLQWNKWSTIFPTSWVWIQQNKLRPIHIYFITFFALQTLLWRKLSTLGFSTGARNIIKDSTHPGHDLFTLLPSGRRYRSWT